MTETDRNNPKTATTGTEDIEHLQEVHLVHGGLDFVDNSVVMGWRNRNLNGNQVVDQLLCLFQDGDSWHVEVDPNSVTIREKPYIIDPRSYPPFILERWSLEQLKRFMRSPEAPKGDHLLSKLVGTICNYLDFSSDGIYYLLPIWAIGTYLTPCFPAFPFLHFLGPKETGKSKVLELLSFLSTNPSKVKTLTVPALGDTMEGMRGTLLVDQAESLPAELVGILSDSYKKAGGQRRVVQFVNGRRTVLNFSTYGPKAFASTKRLADDLQDRCCIIKMIRSSSLLPDLEGWEPEWPKLRDQIIRWVLLNHQNVTRHFSQLPPTGTRLGELWRPLKSILLALGVGENMLGKTFEVFQSGTKETRSELSDMEDALFQIVLDLVKGYGEGEKVETDTTLLVSRVEELLDGAKSISRKWVGDQISKFSIGDRGPRKRRGKQRVQTYTFQPKRVRDLYAKYARAQW